MFNRAYSRDEASTKFGIEMPRSTVHALHFPESFSRTSPLHDIDPLSDVSQDTTPPNESESYMFPMLDTMGVSDDPSPSPPHRSSRNSVMKLENILNDVSIGWVSCSRSHSLCDSPTQADLPFEAIIFPALKMTRSVSPEDRVVKKKKVKMHKCPECQKEFPRPSGLRTHMNMHTKEKPFACTYPGCKRSFSVVSNAKRHMRTHGVGVRIEDHSSGPSSSVPYVVGFEAPVIVSPAEADLKEPLTLRWVAPTSSTGSSSGSTSSGGSSRARSLSAARSADIADGVTRPTNNDYRFRSTSSEMDSHSELDSPPWRSSDDCFTGSGSNPSSPRSFSEVQTFDDHNFFSCHRRVESERSTSTGVLYVEATNRFLPELTH